MPKAYEIIHTVFEAYRGLPERLATLTGKASQLYRSHGYEPKTDNPMAGGIPSPTTHFIQQCELYEAAKPGAGQMLVNRVHAELCQRFAEHDLTRVTDRDIECEVIDQNHDVQKWLASKDIDTASRNELICFERECDEAIEAIHAAKARARAKQKVMGMRSNVRSMA